MLSFAVADLLPVLGTVYFVLTREWPTLSQPAAFMHYTGRFSVCVVERESAPQWRLVIKVWLPYCGATVLFKEIRLVPSPGINTL